MNNDDEFYEGNEDDSDGDVSEFESIVERAKNKNERSLEARRRIERIMELKRLKELDEDVDWENLD